MLSSSTSMNPELTQADSDYVKASGKSFPFCGSQFPHLQNEELHERAPEIFWSLISLSKKFLRMKPSYKYNYKLYLYSCSNNYKYYKTYPFILHMKNEETGWSLKSFSSKILMMYMCRSLSFLTCTMLLYLHTLHYSLNKHLKIPPNMGHCSRCWDRVKNETDMASTLSNSKGSPKNQRKHCCFWILGSLYGSHY